MTAMPADNSLHEKITVQIVYALPEEQTVRTVQVAPGTTARDAIRLSGFHDSVPGFDPDHHPIGIFGQLIAPDILVEDGDRIEIYRPLLIDPKTSRKLRAEAARKRQRR